MDYKKNDYRHHDATARRSNIKHRDRSYGDTDPNAYTQNKPRGDRNNISYILRSGNINHITPDAISVHINLL